MKNIRDGVWPTMITPYTEELKIDWPAVDRLIDWYIEKGVSGIFSVCLSSEIFHLDFEERIMLAKRVAGRCKGRVEVISGVLIDDINGKSSDDIKRVYDTGVKAVVCLVNQLFQKEKEDRDCYKDIESLLARTGDIPLGLYECPAPYHKLLNPEVLKFLIGTGRFYFLKDTSCSIASISAKLDVMRGTSCKFYNAHTPTLLGSLQSGGSGYSGIASNYFPELYAWLCNNFRTHPDMTTRVSDFMTVVDPLVHTKYSAAAKYYMQLCGLPINTNARSTAIVLDDSNKAAVQSLHRLVKELMEELA